MFNKKKKTNCPYIPLHASYFFLILYGIIKRERIFTENLSLLCADCYINFSPSSIAWQEFWTLLRNCLVSLSVDGISLISSHKPLSTGKGWGRGETVVKQGGQGKKGC